MECKQSKNLLPLVMDSQMVVCPNCNGTTHHKITSVTCADCIEIREEFRDKFPDIVKKIEEWKNAKADS